ncbi:nuclear transport factor 2 family protein [Nocardia sp. NPDC005366]|uniref:nuclear transport factor 2 family protein n=1 Tax=Nocardia sp. NPDC005366 TaxID=3156878 RepID=UPI0033B66A32
MTTTTTIGEPVLEALDHIEIRRLADLDGHIVDERAFSRIDEVFTADVVYDLSDFGLGIMRGIPAVIASWRTAAHPLAHHATSVLVTELTDGSAEVITKGLGVGANGRVGSVTYTDRAVRTAAGWRFVHRTATLRRPESISLES